MYLETYPISANGYYTRDFLTLAGPLEDLKVLRLREGDFHPGVLPPPQADYGTFRSCPRSPRSRCKHPEDLRVLGRGLRRLLLAPEYLPSARGCPRASESLAGKTPERGVL